MSEVKCDQPGCKESIIIDGTGHRFKKVVRDKEGGRKTLFFCSSEHQKADGRPDLNETVQVTEEST